MQTNPAAAFWKVQNEFHHLWAVVFYLIGMIAASWHFGYGIRLFAAKWGLTTAEDMRKRLEFLIAVLFVA